MLQEDWSACPSPCRCTWSGGKRTAECEVSYLHVLHGTVLYCTGECEVTLMLCENITTAHSFTPLKRYTTFFYWQENLFTFCQQISNIDLLNENIIYTYNLALIKSSGNFWRQVSVYYHCRIPAGEPVRAIKTFLFTNQWHRQPIQTQLESDVILLSFSILKWSLCWCQIKEVKTEPVIGFDEHNI